MSYVVIFRTLDKKKKRDVKGLLKNLGCHRSILVIEERQALKTLYIGDDIIVKQSDKGGKVVVTDRDECSDECMKILSDKTFTDLHSRGMTIVKTMEKT